MLCYTTDAMLRPQQGGTHRGKGSATIAQDEAETAAETAAETTTAPGHQHRLEQSSSQHRLEQLEPAVGASSGRQQLEPSTPPAVGTSSGRHHRQLEPAVVAAKLGAVGEVGAEKIEEYGGRRKKSRRSRRKC